ncbi:acetyl-CoA carboxylase [Myroides odoratimimus]|uniref:acetyl-CoA carboxylase n=1 Tax=Myroides odoratimimus TaxID=76832 RepID=UPI002DBCE7E4|nr:acetyl-CoA carboxylase [Myroides odoratimimus]MEC4026929.1 acetyl-CoA carboxylase [Myroides odoratimimus]
MKQIILLFASMTLLLFACKKSAGSHGFTIYGESDYYKDGVYCAEVMYENPYTNSSSTYQVSVEVKDGNLVHINWPSEGWLDDVNFSTQNITDGQCSFMSERGYRYTITLGGLGGECYDDSEELQNRVNEDTAQATCPECGEMRAIQEKHCVYYANSVILENNWDRHF